MCRVHTVVTAGAAYARDAVNRAVALAHLMPLRLDEEGTHSWYVVYYGIE